MPASLKGDMRINSRYLAPLLVSLVGVFLAIVVLEGALRIFYRRELESVRSVNFSLRDQLWKIPRLFKKNAAGFFETTDDPFYSTRSQKQSFRLPKPKGVYRIFCIGGSSVQGSPYAIHDIHPEKAFPARLEAALRKKYPNVEVINAGVGAVSTGFLVSVASELTAYDPDLVILYAGHNEYGYYYWSEEALRINPLVFKIDEALQNFYIYRFLLKISRRSFTVPFGDVETGWRKYDKEKWNGKGPLCREIYSQFCDLIPDKKWRRFAEQELYLCARSFRNNVLEIDRRLKNAGIKFMVCTVVSNLRDFYPYFSFHSSGFRRGELKKWKALCARGEKSLELGHYREAIDELSQALKLDNGYAETHFLVAKAYYGLSDYGNARKHFILARDLSPAYAPFQRAPSSLNRLIRTLASEQGMYLCDIERAYYLRKDNQGIPGSDLFWDNLHPNEEGYKYIGQLLAERIEELDLIK